ncbi:MAG: PhoH family protein [Lachnospiraceae bacterium]|nr:PhoH family protein [Lachnospiraceae bacterium]
MKKTYVIDTNVLIQAPYALENFEDNNLVIPLVVLEELDGLKKAEGEKGANAREAIRYLENLRIRGDLLTGVELPTGGMVRVEANCVEVVLPEHLPDNKMDNRILKVCKGIHDNQTDPIILVTKDILLRVKAQMLGIPSQDYMAEQVLPGHAQYSGRCECFVPEDKFKDFKKKGIQTKYAYTVDSSGKPENISFIENQFVIVHADQSHKKTQLGKVQKDKIVALEHKKAKPYEVTPRNVGQYFLQEALMMDATQAPLVVVKGMAGTAKTFYSIAVGLEKILNHPTGEYRKIIISRPNAQFDSDIGFLPGDEQEKISPLMRPVVDNLEQLIDSNEEERYSDELELQGKVAEIFDRGIIQAEAMNFIRGRSFVNTYLIIDEAQNMTPNQIKGIITRAGKGTKIILLGDPNQIDRPFLDERTNGLSYASEHMKGSPYCYQITLTADECERSSLAMDAIQRL